MQVADHSHNESDASGVSTTEATLSERSSSLIALARLLARQAAAESLDPTAREEKQSKPQPNADQVRGTWPTPDDVGACPSQSRSDR